jgi:voltage-gated sodium channel
MTEVDLERLLARDGVAPWRLRLARWIESHRTQASVTGVIVLNAIVLGLETDPWLRAAYGPVLVTVDRLCLLVFVIELLLKLAAYRLSFWSNGWNVFDFAVVGVALVPGAGPWAVLRSLRVLRVLRLLTVVPQLRRVVAAFLHAIPGLVGVMAVMSIFYYTAGVLATTLFGATHPEWFGTIAAASTRSSR